MKNDKPVVWLLAGLALCASVAAGAARQVIPVTTGTVHRDLYSMALAPDGHGIAVGAFGSMVFTQDGGETWVHKNYPTRRGLFDVAIGGDTTVVVGQGGIIMVRQGPDGQWQEKDSGTEQRLLSVDMNANGFGVAVGTFGTLLRTIDGGRTWALATEMNLIEKIEGGYKPHLNQVQVLADGTALVVGEFGVVLRSTDRGATWEIIRQGEASLYGLYVRDNGVGYAVGQQGTVLRTRDAGQTWAAVETNSDGNFLGVYASGDGTVIVPGMRHMIVSDDGGQTWTEVTAGDVDSMWYMDAAPSDNGILAAGHSGRIIRIVKGQDGAQNQDVAKRQNLAKSQP